MKKAASFALGCKVNQYESEAIAELFARAMKLWGLMKRRMCMSSIPVR